MIRSLTIDSVRLLLRWRGSLLLLISGALAGSFVRVTGAAGRSTFHGAEFEGMAIETLASTIFLLTVISGLVAGLVLGGEDRRSGFFAELAVRPVRRITYGAGRLLGLALTTCLALMLLGVGAMTTAGLSAADLPGLRERLRPEKVTVGGRELAAGELGQIRQGSPGRFSFGAGCEPVASLRLLPKVTFGSAASFSGHLDLALTLELESGRRVTKELPSFRPLRELPIRFEPLAEEAPFVLEVEPLSGSFLLEVDRNALTSLGGRVPLARDLAASLVLLWLAGSVAAGIAFLFAVGFSSGPASLAASFLVLIGLGRAAVLDIVAGVGQPNLDQGEVSSWYSGWLPSFLSFLVRLVPDFDRFNPAERLGLGDALPFTAFLATGAIGVFSVAAVLALLMLVVPLKEP
ncbi:MAG: hypothetical protein V2A76_15980 [Planctomycetota bacterium]